MSAAVFRSPGSVGRVEVADLSDPGPPGRSELRVRVGAVAVQPADVDRLRGLDPLPERRSGVVGTGFAGTVEAVGEHVGGFRPGDRAWGFVRASRSGGTAAEVIHAHARFAFRTPPHLTDVGAAALGVAGATAHEALFRLGGLPADAHREIVVIVGGGEPAGAAAVGLAFAAGARVVATADTPRRQAECRRRGAWFAADVGNKNFSDERFRKLGEAGRRRPRVRVWVDVRARPNPALALPHLARGGACVLTAGRAGEVSLPLGPLADRGLSVRAPAGGGGTWRDHAAARAIAGLEPLLSRVYPLDRVGAAFADHEAGVRGVVGGAVVVTVSGG